MRHTLTVQISVIIHFHVDVSDRYPVSNSKTKMEKINVFLKLIACNLSCRVPQTYSSVTGAPTASTTTAVQPMMEAPPRHFLSAIGLQSCSSTLTCHPAESSTIGFHSQSSDTGRLAKPCTTVFSSADSEGQRTHRIEQYQDGSSAGRLEIGRLEDVSAEGSMMEAPPRHFLSIIGLQPCSSTVTCHPSESSTVGLHSQTSVTGRPAEPGTVGIQSRSSITGRPAEPGIIDLPENSWNYTIEGLRIPRIEQFLRGPPAVRHGTGGVEEWDDTQKPVSEVPRAPSHSSIPNVSTVVKVLEHRTVTVPSGDIATEVTSADVTKLKESPSTSKPLRKRVREEDDSVLPMPPKKRYLNTHDGTLVKCAQTAGIKRKAHHQAPSEELTNVAIRRSSRKIKVPRRMDL